MEEVDSMKGMQREMQIFGRLVISVALVGSLVVGAAGVRARSFALQNRGQYVIALSNSFLGNTWRKTMVAIFEHVARQAKAQGMIKDFRVENTAENTATEQIAQIKSLILEHVSAILIDSASPTALNPVIRQACSQHILVVVFDSLASAPCEYNLEDSIAQYGYQEAYFVAKGMHGHGNVIIARGVVGSAPEAVIYHNQLKALKRFPRIHVVATVIGEASNPITERAILSVLPSLPPVQGVITGGSSFGAVLAFQKAHRPLPVVAFDNSAEALRFWQKQHAKTGYTAVSLRTEPGQVAAAFWEALDILHGRKVPRMLVFPNLVITQKTLNRWVKVVPVGDVAAWVWTRQETRREIGRIEHHQPLVTPPIPTSPLPR
jgi:ribose transport system substrate-binding protein